jgi:uncharacterized membrane protein
MTVTFLALLFAVAPIASAQETGSSFGGGDFGGGSDFGGGGSDFGGGGSDWGSSSSSSSWDSSGSSSSWDFGSSSSSSSSGSGSYGNGSYSGGGGGCGEVPGWFALLCVIIVCGVIFMSMREKNTRARWGRDDPSPGPIVGRPQVPAWARMDVSVLMLAIDWRARRYVQGVLENLAKTGDTGSKQGLAKMLRETVEALRDVEIAWLYAGAFNASPMGAAQAEAEFRKAAAEARSRYKKELIRAADGATTTTETPEMKARREDGEGVVVVTLVVAARRDLVDVQNVADAGQVKRLCKQLVRLDGDSMVALEVIWSPSTENDRMSTAELEALYPELRKISENTLAGRVFCTYCGGPYAAELRVCPHCGAPGVAPA